LVHVVDTVITKVSLVMSRVGGVFLLLAALLVSVEVLGRKFLFLPFNVGTELSTYALAVGASWSFAQALLQRAHVRIDVLRSLLPPLARTSLDIVALVSLAAFALIVSWHVWATVETSWSLGARENTPLATPLVIPQLLWFWGIAWFAAVALVEAVRACSALARGDMNTVNRIAAPLGVEDEIDEVLAETGARYKGTG
jgi:TRAP-type mannitol/chloroaromatic compound transport system permease small subunit